MRRFLAICVTLALTLVSVCPTKSAALEFTEFSKLRPTRQLIRWQKRRITVAFSSSINNPGPNFKLGSDVVGAARRALARWSAVVNIVFVETSSTAQSISSDQGDGVSLITVADTLENNAIFTSPEMAGQTRVFYDPETGAIAEADISINPHPATSDGQPLQFSTDGTPGTYDLEATFTHEIGHFLGLEHSVVMGSTMQARQGLNGIFGLPAFTARTLSEDDRERVRSRYGLREAEGALEGKVAPSLAGAQIWVEQNATGRVIATTTVSTDGSYRIENLPPAHYRVLVGQRDDADAPAVAANERRLLRSAELASQVLVNARTTASASSGNTPTPTTSQFLNPRFLGLNRELSSLALPLEAGRTFKIYLGGEGVDQVPEAAIQINSPFFKVEPGTLALEQFGTSFPVVSLQLKVAANAPFGDYSIRLQSVSGEIAYLTGGITVDPGAMAMTPYALDDPRFFVGQHYRDMLGREPDQSGLEYWAGQLDQCGAEVSCLRSQRLAISTAFIADGEVQRVSSFVYGLYKSIGRRPTFSEFTGDRKLMGNFEGGVDDKRQILALDFVKREEFSKQYPDKLSASEFLESLLTEHLQTAAVSSSSERAQLLSLYDGTAEGRAEILTRVLSSPVFTRTEYNRVWVLMQYFGYLRRDPDEAGYNFWLGALQGKSPRDPEAFRSVSCSFLASPEYQARFGIPSQQLTDCSR